MDAVASQAARAAGVSWTVCRGRTDAGLASSSSVRSARTTPQLLVGDCSARAVEQLLRRQRNSSDQGSFNVLRPMALRFRSTYGRNFVKNKVPSFADPRTERRVMIAWCFCAHLLSDVKRQTKRAIVKTPFHGVTAEN